MGRWSGVPLEDRQALRRNDLITAGVTLLGSESGSALTVRAVCRAAGLTERYFYESFSDRDEFADPAVQAMAATGLVGALTTLFTAYLNGRLAATREQFIDYCVDMLLSRVSSY